MSVEFEQAVLAGALAERRRLAEWLRSVAEAANEFAIVEAGGPPDVAPFIATGLKSALLGIADLLCEPEQEEAR